MCYFTASSTNDATSTSVTLSHVLLEEAKLLQMELHGCLACVGSVLARVEAALSILLFASVVLLLLELRFVFLDEGKHASGDFSPS
jgi:hypothetical protein